MEEVASKTKKRQREEEAEAIKLGVDPADILDQKLQEHLEEQYRLAAINYLANLQSTLWKQAKEISRGLRKLERDESSKPEYDRPKPP